MNRKSTNAWSGLERPALGARTLKSMSTPSFHFKSYLVSASVSTSLIVTPSLWRNRAGKKAPTTNVCSLSMVGSGWFCRFEALASTCRRSTGDMFGWQSGKVIIQWQERIKGRREGKVRGQRTWLSHWMKRAFCLHHICTRCKCVVSYFDKKMVGYDSSEDDLYSGTIHDGVLWR